MPLPAPQYLFRVWSSAGSQSAGRNSASGFASIAASRKQQIQDILSMPREDALAMLASHIRWTNTTGPVSNLISFTSSFLWALHFALHEAAFLGGNAGAPNFADVFICIIDTGSRPSFVGRADVAKLHKLTQDDDGLLRKDFNETEWFAQGEVDLSPASDLSPTSNPSYAGSTVSLQDLVSAGLFELFPEINEQRYWGKLHSRVEALRKMYEVPVQAEASRLRIAKCLARCFDFAFTGTMLVWFLSVRTYSFYTDQLVNAVEGFESLDHCLERNANLTSDATLPELVRFNKLVETLHAFSSLEERSNSRLITGEALWTNDLSRQIEKARAACPGQTKAENNVSALSNHTLRTGVRQAPYIMADVDADSTTSHGHSTSGRVNQGAQDSSQSMSSQEQMAYSQAVWDIEHAQTNQTTLRINTDETVKGSTNLNAQQMDALADAVAEKLLPQLGSKVELSVRRIAAHTGGASSVRSGKVDYKVHVQQLGDAKTALNVAMNLIDRALEGLANYET